MPKKAFDTFRNISVLYSGTFAFMAGILSIILLQKGLDLSQVGFYLVLYSISVLLLEVPTGAFADAYGRKKAILLGFFLQVVFLSGFILLPNGSVFIAFAFIVAAADSMLSGSAEAYAIDLLSERGKLDYTHKLLASAKSWQFATFLIGSIIGGYVATFSIIYPVLLCIVFAVFGFLYSWMGLPDDRAKTNFVRSEKKILSNMSDALHYSLANASIRTICLLSLLMGLGSFGLFAYWQPVLKEFAGWNTDSLGVFFALISTSIILGSKISSYLRSDWNTLVLLLFGLFIFLLIAALIPMPLAIAGSIVLWELFWGAYITLENTITNYNATSELRATIISVRSMFYRLGWVVFGFVIALIGTGEPRLFWLMGALFLLVGSVVAFIQSRNSCIR